DEIRCWGANRVGELGRTPLAHGRAVRLADVPAARELALVRDHLVVIDDDGHARVRPLGSVETGEALTGLGVLSGIAEATETLACANADDGALVCLDPARGSHRRFEGFGGRGRVLGVAGRACAAIDGDAVRCVELLSRDEDGAPHVLARGVRDPVAYEGLVCGLRGTGAVACVSALQERYRRDGVRFRETLPEIPGRVSTLFAGAEQMFAVRADGSAVVLGHNGVGQLGRAPSRPIERAAPAVLPAGRTAMAFGFHVSCAYGAGAGVTCAGIDETLAPRRSPTGALFAAFGGPPPDQSVRGDGGWTEIDGPAGARSVSIGDRDLACAAADDGAVWCWGRWPAGAELERVTEPIIVQLGE
ncbi:MAG: hypothetical protein M3Y87_35395, partial [Myxococcota bacterium]|nr:hypothetical protein [Myxococcota bacterium]